MAEDKNEMTLYAVQMCIMRIGLAVSDRLGIEFQEMYPLDVKSPFLKYPVSWKYLISKREIITHANRKLEEKSTFLIANGVLAITSFIEELLKNLVETAQQKAQPVEKKPETSTPTKLMGSFQPFTLFGKKTSIMPPKPPLFPKEDSAIIGSTLEEVKENENKQKEAKNDKSKQELKK